MSIANGLWDSKMIAIIAFYDLYVSRAMRLCLILNFDY